MTEKVENIYTALCAAQAAMGPVVKGAVNPHFKSKYADLADVMQVAIPALSEHGIAVFHIMERDEDGKPLMTTVLNHGESRTEICCPVPLIVQKNDMQGMKSATTYAKRIGIESLTGIAPADDDGNAAAAAAPKKMTAAAAKKNHWPQFEHALTKCQDRDQLAGVWQELRDDAETLPDSYVAACNDALQSHAQHIGIPLREAAE
jgi:hypothetical protein